MRLLFIVHPSFFVDAHREQVLHRVGDYVRELEKLCHKITFFDSVTHKVQDFDVLCFFSNKDPETWYELRKLGKPVIIFPSLNIHPPLLKQVIPALLSFVFWPSWPKPLRTTVSTNFSVLKSFLQCLSLRPKNDLLFFQSANQYFVSPAWEVFVKKFWKIPSRKITLLPQDAGQFARSFHEKCSF